ncbi:MAG TPA: aminotransferase class I/II-fold pyridoxal phosphate-dependent enzyme [Clostridiaceae bacterium]|nr:aminotransferase class I/II-fold pyridoxal phosphate-dependent enzyme [Clostridiaceae bacterium]
MKRFDEIQQIGGHYGDDHEKFLGAVVPPIFSNTIFKFPTYESNEENNKNNNRYSYTRIQNPTYEIAEKKIAKMENGEVARCYVSGVSAIFSALSAFLEKDAHVVCIKHVYGRVNEFLDTYFNRFGVETTRVSGEDLDEIVSAIRPNTRIIYLESPSSLLFKLQDLAAIAKIAREKGIYTMIDNTWATPVFQNPLDLGIDIVIHSISKYLGGHSDIVGGVVISSKEIMKKIPTFGSFLPPFEAWLLIRSLRTLGVRMRQHQENGIKVAKYLESHPKILSVNYPALESHPQYELGRKQMKGYSSVFGFEIDTDREGIKRFINNLNYFTLGPSWGGYESIITAMACGRTDEEVLATGCSIKYLRISIGLEDADVLTEDLENALKHV